MPFDPTPLLALPTEAKQREWLINHVPTRNDELLLALEEEAAVRWRKDAKTAETIAKIVSLAAEVWSDQEVVAKALHLEANTQWCLAEHKTALVLYEASMNLYQSLNLPAESARVAVGQLNAMMYLGKYDEALRLANDAVTICEKHNDTLSLAKIIMNRGNIYFRLSQYRDALVEYEMAQGLFTQLNDTHYIAMAQVNAASMQMMLDNFNEAEQLLQQARLIFVDQGLQGILAITDHNLAELSFYQGNYQHALQIFNKAKETFNKQENEVDAAYVDLYRSDVYLALNLWAEALTLTQEIRPIFIEAEMNWEVGRSWLNEAVALAHLEDGRSPDTALREAKTIFATENNQIWLAATDLYEATFARLSNQYDIALVSAQNAATIYAQAEMHSRAAQCYALVGDVLVQTEAWSEAEQTLQKALAEIAGAYLPAITYLCHYGLGRIALAKDNISQAREHYQQSILAIEQLQAAIGAEDYKIAFLSDKMRVYEGYVLLCLREDNDAGINEAFATVEKAKSRALLDALAREIDTIKSDEANSELLYKLDNLKRELNWYYNRLNGNQDNNERSSQQWLTLTKAVAQREKQLSKLLNQWRQPDLATAPNNPIWTINAEKMQESIPNGLTLLEYFISGQQIILFGIDKETVWYHSLDTPPAVINDLLSQYRFQMNKFSYGPTYRQRYAASLLETTTHTLQTLYELLLAPIYNRITHKTIVIIPHGLLHYVPFHALYDGEKHLIEKNCISYAPSATILYRLMNQTIDLSNHYPMVIGLDDPTIPLAQQEAQTIASMFPDAHLYTAEAATVATLKGNIANASFLHLSTHATFRNDNPLFSALKLADGWVSVNDLYNLPQVPPLVTLSACETGRYQIAVGDELVGLCRGLFSAGAQSIVVSLWMVEDAATADLMKAFYAHLQKGETVSAALRKAQLMIKKEKPHPYYWAPFILLGRTINPIRYSVKQDQLPI